MEYNAEDIKSKAAGKKKQHKKKIDALKKKSEGEVDAIFHELHEEVFQEIDCLTCANCCKTTGPLLLHKDVERLSQHFRMKPSEFTEKYLRIDEDRDYVFKSMPCPFLAGDNYCTVYESRPKACREYPHTDRRNMKQILNLTLKNCEVCPAVCEIMDRV